MAPYRLRPDSVAFGVRAGWREHARHGNGEFEALYLFELDGERLRLVLAEPMMAHTFIMVKSKSDGPGSVKEVQDSNTVVISKHASEGYYDLQIKSQASRKARTLTWSAQHREYRAPVAKALAQ